MALWKDDAQWSEALGRAAKALCFIAGWAGTAMRSEVIRCWVVTGSRCGLRRGARRGGRWGPDVFAVVQNLVHLKVAGIHPLLPRPPRRAAHERGDPQQRD